MLVSPMMTGHDDGSHTDGPIEMATYVSRAHEFGDARRWIYTSLHEGFEQKGKWARKNGTRDAASIWGDTWSEVLKDGSMKIGTACAAFFCSSDGNVKRLVPQRRLLRGGTWEQLQIFRKCLGETV